MAKGTFKLQQYTKNRHGIFWKVSQVTTLSKWSLFKRIGKNDQKHCIIHARPMLCFFSRSYDPLKWLCTILKITFWHNLLKQAPYCFYRSLRFFVDVPALYFHFPLWNNGPGQCCHLVEQQIIAQSSQCACANCVYKACVFKKIWWCA